MTANEQAKREAANIVSALYSGDPDELKLHVDFNDEDGWCVTLTDPDQQHGRGKAPDICEAARRAVIDLSPTPRPAA